MEAAQPPAQAPAKRISMGGVIRETLSIYGQNLGVLLSSAIVVFVVVGLVLGLAQASGGVLLAVLYNVVQLVAFPVYTGVVVKLVQDVRDGKRDHAVGDLFSAASGAIPALIVFGILSTLGLSVGFVLLVIPGLILLTFWSVGAPAIVVERVGPIEAFGRSWDLVRGDAWRVFGVIVLFSLIVFGIVLLLAAIATPIDSGEVATVVVTIISGVLTAPIYALPVSILYYDLGGGEAAHAPAAQAPVAPDPAAPPPPPTPTS